MNRLKIIAALDGLNLSESTIQYSIYLANTLPAHIVAAMLEDISYHALSEDENGSSYLKWSDVEVVERKDKLLQNGAMKRVKYQLETNAVEYTIHNDKFIAIDALLRESHYADLIIIDGDERFANGRFTKPAGFIKTLLAYSGCPVIVLPNSFAPIDKIVFCYDGTPSSVYAIRQFSYLFPSVDDREIEILMITDDLHSNHLPNRSYLKELLKLKYEVVLQTVIKSDKPGDALIAQMQNQSTNCLLVLGSYQRNTLSRFLRHSLADSLIRKLGVPLFITHK